MSESVSPSQALLVQSNYSRAMGFRLLHAGAGRARIECVVSDAHTNTRGFCHGGVISGLMDMAAGVATKAGLDDPARAVATVSLTVNYLRPAAVGRVLVAEGSVSGGRRIVSCELAVRDDQDALIASGLATLHVR